MSDSYTEVTSQNWFSRIGESIKGILFGIVIIPLMIILLWWNEGRAVTTAREDCSNAERKKPHLHAAFEIRFSD